MLVKVVSSSAKRNIVNAFQRPSYSTDDVSRIQTVAVLQAYKDVIRGCKGERRGEHW